MLPTDRTEQMYQFIGRDVTRHEALLSYTRSAEAVKLTKGEVEIADRQHCADVGDASWR
ncbi:MAG: hypothetical protein ABI700_08540 [Chloroflexota bacterium]